MTRREATAMLLYGASMVACGSSGPPAPGAPRTKTATTTAKTMPETNIDVRTSYPPMPPLGDDVHARRRARARELTRAANADVLFATSGGANFTYLVGANFGRSERLIVLLLPVDGDAVVFAPSFEVPRVTKRARSIEVRGWEE